MGVTSMGVRRVPFSGKPPYVTWRLCTVSPPVAVIDTRQQHDKYKEVRINHRPSSPPIVAAECTADNDISVLLVFLRLGHLLSATRCRVGRLKIDAREQ